MNKPRCESCGSLKVEYGHRLSIGLVEALRAIGQFSEAVHLARLGLSVSQITNFQKLKYWGLVEQGEKAGFWQITETGRSFLNECALVPAKVWTFHGSVVRVDPELIRITDVVHPSQERSEFTAAAEAHDSLSHPAASGNLAENTIAVLVHPQTSLHLPQDSLTEASSVNMEALSL